MSSKPAGQGRGRSGLTRLLKGFWFLLFAAIGYVLLDFAIDLRPAAIQSSYRFEIGELEPDEVKLLRQDNLSILVARRSPQTIERLRQSVDNLQDPDSGNSRQPDYAHNRLRSREPQYFVSYAIGTDLGCPLRLQRPLLRETCGDALYDLAGRALAGAKRFPNLSIPDYNFSDDFRTLTIKP